VFLALFRPLNNGPKQKAKEPQLERTTDKPFPCLPSKTAGLLRGVVTSISSKLLNNVALQAVRKQREAGSKRKKSEARDNRALLTAAG